MGRIDIDNLIHLNEHIEGDGRIDIGEFGPVNGAVASDGHNSLAMLVRRDRETLSDLLVRLDEAIRLANEEGIFTDEVNVR